MLRVAGSPPWTVNPRVRGPVRLATEIQFSFRMHSVLLLKLCEDVLTLCLLEGTLSS